MPVHLDHNSVLSMASLVVLQTLGEGEGGVILRLKTGEMYTVNDPGLEFLALLDGTRSIKTIVSALVLKFDIDEDTLSRDLIAIAGELVGEELVVVV